MKDGRTARNLTYSRTRTHRLKFSGGRRVLVHVAETAGSVHISISGDRLGDADMPRMARLMWPVISVFKEDRRSLYLSSEHVAYTGCITVAESGLLLTREPNKRGRH